MTRHEFPRIQEAYEQQVLPNGLTVRVVKRPGFAKKYAILAVNYGSIDTTFVKDGVRYETPAGVAHYLEHKMFDLPEGNAMSRFAAYGGSDNAFTSQTATAYYVDCTDCFEENLETLVTMVTTPHFTPESVEKERGIIAQEIRMYEDSPGSVVAEDLLSAMYESHPIRVGIAGTVESIGEITAETLYDCYNAFYVPSNMILCVVGDVDAASVAHQVEKLLPGTGPAPAVGDYGPEETLIPPCHRVTRRMEISMPTFQIGFRCPAPALGDGVLQQEIVADLALEVLLGESSRLYEQMYEEGLIDSSFGGYYEQSKNVAMLACGGDSDDPDAVLERLIAEVERLKREGIDPELFRRLKRAAIGSRIRSLDSFEGVAFRLCGYFFEKTEYYRFPEVFDGVDEQQVLAFLADTVQRERAAIAIIYPLEKEVQT